MHSKVRDLGVLTGAIAICSIIAAAVIAIGTAALISQPAEAGSRAKSEPPVIAGGHKKSSYYRGTRVKGYVERRGGYSYSKEDTINTYGDGRNRYGSAISLRDPKLDRQTTSGPFDHGFFFDSGIAPRGGDAPYMN